MEGAHSHARAEAGSIDRWAEDFRRLSDEDLELQAHGRHYTCSYLLDTTQHRVVIEMSRGRLAELTLDPGPLDAHYQFAIRASADSWRKFCQPEPPPMYQGLWAASFRGLMRLEGDLLPLMQNVRCLTRQLELLRISGPPVESQPSGGP